MGELNHTAAASVLDKITDEPLHSALNVWRHRVHAMRKGPIGAWFRDNGEELMWRDLPITAKDVCLDVGGYRGDWTAELLVRYGAPSIVFEAVPAFADKIAERFTHNTLVTVRAAAIGTRTGKGEIALADDGSSFHGAGPPLSIDVIDVESARPSSDVPNPVSWR